MFYLWVSDAFCTIFHRPPATSPQLTVCHCNSFIASRIVVRLHRNVQIGCQTSSWCTDRLSDCTDRLSDYTVVSRWIVRLHRGAHIDRQTTSWSTDRLSDYTVVSRWLVRLHRGAHIDHQITSWSTDRLSGYIAVSRWVVRVLGKLNWRCRMAGRFIVVRIR